MHCSDIHTFITKLLVVVVVVVVVVWVGVPEEQTPLIQLRPVLQKPRYS